MRVRPGVVKNIKNVGKEKKELNEKPLRKLLEYWCYLIEETLEFPNNKVAISGKTPRETRRT